MATEFGLLVTLVSVLVTGSIAALLGQVWHFDPCEIFQVCSNAAVTPAVGDTSDPGTQRCRPDLDVVRVAVPVAVRVAVGLSHVDGRPLRDRARPLPDGLCRPLRFSRPLS